MTPPADSAADDGSDAADAERDDDAKPSETERLKAEVKEWKERCIRSQAEFENVRKRLRKEADEAGTRAVARFVKPILNEPRQPRARHRRGQARGIQRAGPGRHPHPREPERGAQRRGHRTGQGHRALRSRGARGHRRGRDRRGAERAHRPDPSPGLQAARPAGALGPGGGGQVAAVQTLIQQGFTPLIAVRRRQTGAVWNPEFTVAGAGGGARRLPHWGRGSPA